MHKVLFFDNVCLYVFVCSMMDKSSGSWQGTLGSASKPLTKLAGPECIDVSF